MPCYHPISAFKSEHGGITFREDRHSLASLDLPCGQCIGCRLERSRQWAVRCMHEAQMHTDNVFITLTYDNEHLPENSDLCYQDFQLFMKRLRKQKGKVRFYMAGEYGEQFGRPHFHACLFGCKFDNLESLGTKGKEEIFRSPELEALWPHGYSSIGNVTFESAAYVARYIMKKITGDQAKDHYKFINAQTGEVFKRTPEFNRMSLKPGIGASWYEKYQDDVYPHDEVIVRGRKQRPPRYYDKKLKETNPDLWEEIDFKRLKSREHIPISEKSIERMEVKKRVKQAQLKQLIRKI